jgi:hypothetical protein
MTLEMDQFDCREPVQSASEPSDFAVEAEW